MAYDQSVYYLTKDSPGGPMYQPVREPINSQISVPLDEEGNMTTTGKIVYSLAYLIMFATFLYFWFSV